jgi:glucan 1,3-beta-glucosidase
MGLLDKIKHRTSKSGPSSSSTLDLPPPSPELPLEQSLPRYRKQKGLNLGSWFVLEQWIAPQAFKNAVKPGQSDHDIAKGKDAKAILEDHWDSWIKNEDWEWIRSKGFNSVRIPVSGFTITAY